MGQIDTNKKLELVRSIRMNQQNNRAVLNNREQLLYGTSRPLVAKGEVYGLESAALTGTAPEAAIADSGNSLKSFKIRLLIAVILFAAFVFLDRTGQSVMGITTKQVAEAITTESKEVLGFAAKLFDLF